MFIIGPILCRIGIIKCYFRGDQTNKIAPFCRFMVLWVWKMHELAAFYNQYFRTSNVIKFPRLSMTGFSRICFKNSWIILKFIFTSFDICIISGILHTAHCTVSEQENSGKRWKFCQVLNLVTTYNWKPKKKY